jgi:protein O-mannosyl-transferase
LLKNILYHRSSVGLLLIVVTLAIFSPIRNHEFVWDDRSNVTENPYLRQVTGANFLSFWQRPYQQLYIPLTYTVWAGIAALAGNPTVDPRNRLDAGPFHVVNLILHTLSVLVVFVILRMLIRNDWAAGAGALLFGLHPLQVEAVSWVTGMKDVLSGLLSLVALWQYLNYAAAVGAKEQTKGVHYGLATCAFVLALLAKPSAVALPVVAWVLDYGLLKRSLRQSARSLGGWVVLAIIFVGVTNAAQPPVQVDLTSSLWARPLIAADALAFYLYKLILPFGLTVDYGRTPAVVLGWGWANYTWILPVGLAALLWAWGNRARYFITAAALFAAGLLPVLGLIPFGFQQISTVADRYVYLSLFGPALALACALSQWTGKVTTVVVCIVLTALASLSAVQARYWHDDVTLSQHALELNAKSWLAHYHAGIGSARMGAVDDAVRHFTAALAIKPENTETHYRLGNVLAMEGNFDEAIRHYKKVLEREPTGAAIYFNLGNAFSRLNRFSEAVEQYEKSLKADPSNSATYGNLGHALFRQNKLGEALVQYRKALEIDPDAADVHYSLANILAAQGELDDAMDHYRAALRVNPSYAGVYYNLGVILAKRGQLDDAIRHFRQALTIRPNFADAHESLGKALALQGHGEEASRHYREALRILSAGGQPEARQ